MATGSPSLVIPIRFNPNAAIQGLNALNAATAQGAAQAQKAASQSAQQSANAQVQGAKKAQKAVKDLSDAEVAAAAKARMTTDANNKRIQEYIDQTNNAKKSTKEFGSDLASLALAGVGLGAIKASFGAIAEQADRTSEYVRDVAKEFVGLRKSMQEVAALRGKANSNEFTVEEAEKARAAGLTPQERRDFQAEFLNYAGSQVGGANAAEMAQKGTKLTDEQGEEFGNRIALLMKANGVDPKVGAELGGSMLEQSDGPQDVDKLMGRFSKTFQVLQKGRVPLKKALPEISQIMSMGVSAEDAAKMFAIVSPAASGQEGTSVQAALRAIQEMKNNGTGEEFGVKQGMGQYESVKAFAENINKRQQDLVAQGKTEQEASDEVQKQLADKKVAADSREARGLVRGFGRQGINLGGFKQFEREEAATPATYEADKTKQYLDSAGGQQDMRDADTALADAQAGARNVRIAEIRQEAENQLKNEKRFERFEAGNLARGAIAKAGGASVKDQLINERATQISDDEAGVPKSERRLTNFGAGNSETNERILKNLERQTALMEKADQRDGQKGAPPLAAPPPNPRGRQ